MEFFEEAINKAKDAFDVACKKTEEVVSIQKQKLDLASMESKLSKTYAELGKLCIDAVLSGENPGENARILAEDIRKKEAEIEVLRNEILKAKGKKFCKNCGAANVSQAHFCYACGNSFIEAE